jgi:hypothetical protein
MFRLALAEMVAACFYASPNRRVDLDATPSDCLARPLLAHRTRPGRRPRRLLTEGTPAAGVIRPIINICDNVPHVRDWHRWGSGIEASSSVAVAKVGGSL